jgi:hypothetical protein
LITSSMTYWYGVIETVNWFDQFSGNPDHQGDLRHLDARSCQNESDYLITNWTGKVNSSCWNPLQVMPPLTFQILTT